MGKVYSCLSCRNEWINRTAINNIRNANESRILRVGSYRMNESINQSLLRSKPWYSPKVRKCDCWEEKRIEDSTEAWRQVIPIWLGEERTLPKTLVDTGRAIRTLDSPHNFDCQAGPPVTSPTEDQGTSRVPKCTLRINLNVLCRIHWLATAGQPSLYLLSCPTLSVPCISSQLFDEDRHINTTYSSLFDYALESGHFIHYTKTAFATRKSPWTVSTCWSVTRESIDR